MERRVDEDAIRRRDEKLLLALRWEQLRDELEMMQALRSALDGLALERVSTPSANAEIAAMRLAVVRMAANTRQLQVFTQQQVLQPVEIELNAWLEEMSWLLRGLVEDAATLEVSLHDAPLRVRVDAAQLELAVINVVENARDAVELALRPGRVRVGAEVAELRDHAELDDGHYARLSVIDDGIGIAPESLEKIFQSDYSTKDELRGSGMGLANVRRVVRDVGGGVSVTSAPSTADAPQRAHPRSARRWSLPQYAQRQSGPSRAMRTRAASVTLAAVDGSAGIS